ncbi:MAG: UvrD-helicase domain-containing protein [Candidatus Methanoculleus thermohydrogenotrophicum]|nr:UvrD-helicase domain-containing protein [Candidatus Methanoculleus thermohydrogenotrophicum]
MRALQDALVRQWIDQADRVYVAGDPEQSIYRFRGCRPDLFLSLPAEDRGSAQRQPADLPAVRHADHGDGRTDLRPGQRTWFRTPLPGRCGREVYFHAPGALASRIEDALQV